jgi:secernin
MCDTWVAMKDATMSGGVILAKNSDRPIFDCQPLILQPRQRWQSAWRSILKLTCKTKK